ncbi:hypothetical protein HPB51_008414 [Rhipicephalus microplus]|uniref:Regulatory protein zeste n=1 Tax=Rhipicephalus microplus TaxID=6941 RepID=A0A9J6DFL6_RHIMP|nr:hypothetical protein HPB51_008414 [Rhipicephalus microplus]
MNELRQPSDRTCENTPRKQFFTDDEKDVVTELVQKCRSSIENEKLDVVSLGRKQKLWEALAANNARCAILFFRRKAAAERCGAFFPPCRKTRECSREAPFQIKERGKDA